MLEEMYTNQAPQTKTGKKIYICVTVKTQYQTVQGRTYEVDSYRYVPITAYKVDRVTGVAITRYTSESEVYEIQHLYSGLPLAKSLTLENALEVCKRLKASGINLHTSAKYLRESGDGRRVKRLIHEVVNSKGDY